MIDNCDDCVLFRRRDQTSACSENGNHASEADGETDEQNASSDNENDLPSLLREAVTL